MLRRIGLQLVAIWVIGISTLVVLQAAEPVDYEQQIKPVLRERCYACHGVLKQKAGLRLDTAAFAIKGGEAGETIIPGEPENSELFLRVSSTDESDRMPPEGEPLKPEELAAIKTWIAEGAKAPVDELPERDPREHWSFRSPVRPPVPQNPEVQKDARTNPIDAFLAVSRQQRGLKTQPLADKRVWLRRVTLDLIGLPPAVAELEDFLADESPAAYDKVVSRLLESPQYGERWGRHWMDIWRYSDWWGLGSEVRNSQKHIWHWRDWIIESLNEDKGYDQMLREMLAADELYPNDLDKLRASGFLARQYFKFNRTSWLDETVEHTAKSMLGLTFNCAKCHDHKYDPFSQVEYYQMRAIFEPYQIRTDAVPGVVDFEQDGIPRAFDCNLDVPTYLHIRGDDRNPDQSKVIPPDVPAFLTFDEFDINTVTLPADASQPGLRSFVMEAHKKQAAAAVERAQAALAAAKKVMAESEKIAAANPPEEKKPSDDKPDTAEDTAEKSAPATKVLVADDFAVAKPDVWELRDGDWKYEEGKLHQKQTGAKRAILHLKTEPPADFEARLTYIPTGGDRWKSVGISFDVTPEGDELLAYLSSVEGGQKAQFSYTVEKKAIYPLNAMQARAVELNKPHELLLRVRGNLVNVSADGEHSIAYLLSQERRKGALELIAFDAQATFVSFELRKLTSDVKLVEATAAPAAPATPAVQGPPDIATARALLVVAEKAVATALAEEASVHARTAADHAQFESLDSSEIATLKTQAALSERTVAVAKAAESVARAEVELLKSPADKKEASEKSLAATRTAFETAEKALENPGESYQPLRGALKTLESNLETEASRSKPFPETSTGRRSALAEWITDPRHPLPARVAVNHIWSRHFGRPLVATVFDFGRKGSPPTHPELLDWLAVEFVEHGWSIKHLHRLMVTSDAYRRSSSNADVDAATFSQDPDNRFYWRANPIRMEAQLVRDSLLSLAGELDLTVGGPPVPAADESSRRRSLYFVHSHNEHQKFLAMFDDANVLDCYRRSESIVPQQALALENSELAASMAAKIYGNIKANAPNSTDAEFTRIAFLTVLSVEPTSEEAAVVLTALERWRELSKGRENAAEQARTNLILALLNHNDFVTIR